MVVEVGNNSNGRVAEVGRDGKLRWQVTNLKYPVDAIVLPGSPADVDPKRYGETRHRLSAEPDVKREYTDGALLDHAGNRIT